MKIEIAAGEYKFVTAKSAEGKAELKKREAEKTKRVEAKKAEKK